MVCVFCKEYIPVGATVCPTCGKPIEKEKEKAEKSADNKTAKSKKKG